MRDKPDHVRWTQPLNCREEKMSYGWFGMGKDQADRRGGRRAAPAFPWGEVNDKRSVRRTIGGIAERRSLSWLCADRGSREVMPHDLVQAELRPSGDNWCHGSLLVRGDTAHAIRNRGVLR